MTWRVLNPWSDLAGLPRDSWTLALAQLVNRMGTMVLPFLTLHFTDNLHLSKAAAGGALAVYGIVALIIAPLSGRLADRVGSPRVLVASLIGGGLALWLFPLARTLPHVLAAMVILAMVTEAMRPATLALVSDLAPPELRRQAYALNRLAINLGMSVGPALGGFLATRSFSALFWVDGATSIAAGIVLLLFPLHPKVHVDSAPRPALGALGDGRLRYALLAVIPALFVFFQHTGSMPVWMVQDMHMSTRDFGLLFTVNTLLIVFLEVRLNSLTGHWAPGRSMSVGALFCGLGFGALAVATSYWAIVATVVVWTFGEMILFPANAAYVAELAPPSRRGEYMGFYTMTFGLGFTFGPWAGLVTYQALGARGLWLGCLAAGALSAGFLARVAKPPKAAAPAVVPATG
jgi:MFS family permease